MAVPKIVIVIVVVLVVGLLGWSFLGQNTVQAPTQPTPAQIDRSINVAAPTPTPISKEVPVTIITNRGTVETISASSITLKTTTGNITATFSSSVDVQKLVSGTLEKGDAKTAPAKIADIKVGQEVLAVINKGTSQARSLLIVK